MTAYKHCRGQTSFRIIRTSMPALEGHILICGYFNSLFVTIKLVLPRLIGRACFLGAADSSCNLKGESFTGYYPPTARYSAGIIGRNLLEARSTTGLCRIHCFRSSSPGETSDATARHLSISHCSYGDPTSLLIIRPPSSTDLLSPAKRAQRPSFQNLIFTRRYKHLDSLTAVLLLFHCCFTGLNCVTTVPSSK